MAVTLKVKPLSEKYAPTGKTITVAKNTTLDAALAESAIEKNNASQIASYSWETTPNADNFGNNLP